MDRYGVLGWPVAHSRSPAMFAAIGVAYQLLPVPPALFAETTRALPGAGFGGANVTIPHKRAALALADAPSERARAIGAANTLIFRAGADGVEIAADNTDAPGLIAALGEPLAGRTALVLGAGGSARAAVWALADAGAAEVRVWNRTPERAEELAAELGATAARDAAPADVLVNCTSAGLGDPAATFDELPLAPDDLGAFATVADLVYRPEGTALLREAAARGARTVDGIEVLVRQGALSHELWT
ncbi:MAG TPA: shikimate dehydrogenase, partial [Solirubrobacteraceae bacterium]|nr:shikimate dehydrogenase [Solirubrobacteraceae bacterium]